MDRLFRRAAFGDSVCQIVLVLLNINLEMYFSWNSIEQHN